MSAPSTDQLQTAAATRPTLRPWLAALLPFTALGLLPWWVCLALSAALALGRLNDDSRSIGALLALLAAVLVSGPALLGAAPGRLLASGTLFAQAALVGLLALTSMRALENGQRRGLLLPAAALLLFPGPGGLVALLLAGVSLNGPETRPTVRLDQPASGFSPARRMLALLLAAALALAAAGLLLGQVFPAVPGKAPASSASQAASGPTAAPNASPRTTATRASGGTRAGRASQTAPPPEDQALLLRPLVPVTGLLIVVCTLLLLQNTRLKRAERRSSWTDYAALAAMLGTLFMVGVIGAGAGQGGQPGTPAVAEARSGGQGTGAVTQAADHAPAWITPLLNAGLVFATLFFAVVAVYLYLALRAARVETAAGRSALAPPATTPEVLPPLHRVRLAWRGLETGLAAAGLTRLASETPEEFSARLCGLLPAAAADLGTLTRLYLPVRYGGVLGESDADTAEASAEGIQKVLRDADAVT